MMIELKPINSRFKRLIHDFGKDWVATFGVIIGTIGFAVGNRGPIDAGEIRQVYRDMCSNWINNGILPENIHLT